MQNLTLGDMADFLELAVIEKTDDLGYALVHVGRAGAECGAARFVLVNDLHGNSVLSVG